MASKGPQARPDSRGYLRAKFNGKLIYFGRDSKEAHEEFARFKARWIENGRRLPEKSKPAATPKLTVAQLVESYNEHCTVYYNGSREADNVAEALTPVNDMFGTLPAAEFGIESLKAVVRSMIERGLARTTVNGHLSRIKGCWRWAATEQKLDAKDVAPLLMVKPEKKGRTKAKENPPRRPVTDAELQAVLPYLDDGMKALVHVLRATAMRLGEALQLCTEAVDMKGPTWAFMPQHHKTQHRGHSRVVAIGPEAQKHLRPLVKLARGKRWFEALGTRQAIAVRLRRACLKAKKAKALKRPWVLHELRHARITEVRRSDGIEAAMAVSGHVSEVMARHYAREAEEEARRKAASRIAAKSG